MQREQNDRVISLDPNIRPTLIHNRDGYLARLDRLVAMADIARLSDEDLDWIAPGASFEDLARRWLDRGAKLVILTRGAEGATALTQQACRVGAGHRRQGGRHGRRRRHLHGRHPRAARRPSAC